MDRNEVVDQISSQMKMFVPEAETILYGSQARGDARPDSDIDLLILLPELYDGMGYVNRRSYIFGLLYELSLKTGIDISPIIIPRNVWNSKKTPFSINVNNEGIRI